MTLLKQIITYLILVPVTTLVLTPLVIAETIDNSGENLVSSSLKTFGALLLVLVLIVVLSWAAKRYLNFLPSTTLKGGVIKVVETKPLGPKRSLHVVDIEGQRLLIGSSEGGIAFLQKLDNSDKTASE